MHLNDSRLIQYFPRLHLKPSPVRFRRFDGPAFDRNRLTREVAIAHQHHDRLRDLLSTSGPPNRNARRDARLNQRPIVYGDRSPRLGQCKSDCLPMPREPPVTRATRPFSSSMPISFDNAR